MPYFFSSRKSPTKSFVRKQVRTHSKKAQQEHAQQEQAQQEHVQQEHVQQEQAQQEHAQQVHAQQVHTAFMKRLMQALYVIRHGELGHLVRGTMVSIEAELIHVINKICHFCKRHRKRSHYLVGSE